MDLTTSYVGLTLRNPFIAAPAGTTETVDRMKRSEDAGIGAVVMKTLFETEFMRRSPTPRFRLLRHDLGTYKTFTLYSYEQAHVYGPQEFAAELARAKEQLSVPVIASIGCTEDSTWIDYLNLVQQAGADAVELNVSCPHGPTVLGEHDVVDEGCRVLGLLANHRRLPLIPKMTGQLTDPVRGAQRLEEAGADAVVMFNRHTGLDIDLEAEAPIMHGGYAGHGGPWALSFVLRWISATSPHLRIPIAASGGVSSGEDAAKLLLVGATVVQVCSAIVLQGYRVIGRMVRGLERFMEDKGYRSPNEFRGKAVDRIVAPERVDREPRVVARINPELCTACGICQRVCIYDAVDAGKPAYAINSQCAGCGLCPELCPEAAISLVPIGGQRDANL